MIQERDRDDGQISLYLRERETLDSLPVERAKEVVFLYLSSKLFPNPEFDPLEGEKNK
jgi:hypothetical protein